MCCTTAGSHTKLRFIRKLESSKEDEHSALKTSRPLDSTITLIILSRVTLQYAVRWSSIVSIMIIFPELFTRGCSVDVIAWRATAGSDSEGGQVVELS